MDPRDPKLYYAALGVGRKSSARDIEKAYRRKAMAWHPDRNKETIAKERFQTISEAYSVLGVAAKRAAYDTSTIDPHARATAASAAAKSTTAAPLPEPMRCSNCKRVSAQPRYVIFYEVKSLIFVCLKTPIQGVFCSDCAERKALQATVSTWIFGWWGLPWGPIYSISALLTNMFGGQMPILANARLIAYQAFTFALKGRSDLAVAVAREATEFIDRLPSSEPLRDELTRDNAKILGKLKAESSSARLKDTWKLVRRPFILQAVTFLGISGWITLEAYRPVLHVISYFR